MSELDDTVTKPTQRPKRRDLWFAWLMTAIVACCLVVMNSRGQLIDASIEFVIDSKTGRWAPTCRHEHGWPMKWIGTQPIDTPSGKPLAASLSSLLGNKWGSLRDESWVLYATPLSTDYVALFFNLLVATFVLAAIFFACRIRTKRRKGFKFSLLEITIVISLVSIALANYQYHSGVSSDEQQLIVESEGSIRAIDYQWQSPSALRALVGEPSWLSVYRHVDRFELKAGEPNAAIVKGFERFAFAKSVTISGDPSLQQVESLAGIEGLESIEVSSVLAINLSRLGLPGSRIRSSLDEIVANGIDSIQVRESRELHESRIKLSDATFSSVTRLSIDSSRGYQIIWPRALDLVSRCPNLKEVSLIGPQYIVEDLMNLPPSIEVIEYGFLASPEDEELLSKKYPNATTKNVGNIPFDDQKVWELAEVRVNRRRSTGWDGSLFQKGMLDLSFTEVDRKFLSRLSATFPDTKSIVFGSFDSTETAIWLTHQCPKLIVVNTNGAAFGIDDAMQFPSYLRSLIIDQSDIAVDEFAKLVVHLQLEKLRIKSSKFEPHEVQEIRKSNPDCDVKLLGR